MAWNCAKKSRGNKNMFMAFFGGFIVATLAAAIIFADFE